MVVKENKGRKRYILFKHPRILSKKQTDILFKDLFKNLKGKISWKLIKFKKDYGILRVDHKIVEEIRLILAQYKSEKGIITTKTSGTLKALMK